MSEAALRILLAAVAPASPLAPSASIAQAGESEWLGELADRLPSWVRQEVMGIAVWQFGAGSC